MGSAARGHADFYAPGDWNAVCYECGRKFKASELKRHWQGYYVCSKHWEPRQPQDFVRGVQDVQTPPWTQPMPPDPTTSSPWLMLIGASPYPNYTSVSNFSMFDEQYWYVTFPRPAIAAVTNATTGGLKISCGWVQSDDLVQIVWDTVDVWDHPWASYSMSSNYSTSTITFQVTIDSSMIPFDAVNGLTMTIETPAGSNYVQLWSYRVSGTNTSAIFHVDFSNVRSGWGATGPLVDTTNVIRVFMSFANINYGTNTKYSTYQYGTATMKILSSTGPGINVTTPNIPDNHLEMTGGYDDSYHLNPLRTLTQYKRLGYSKQITVYMGMSHMFKLGWSTVENRALYTLQTEPINNVSREWFTTFASTAASLGIDVVFSMSYEMLNEFAPTNWRQMDYLGRPALTGWTPPSTLLAFTMPDVMQHLKNTAMQIGNIAYAAGLKTFLFQVGEPWWWDGSYSNTGPCFYDPYTVALYPQENNGASMYVFQTPNDLIDNPQKQATATWLRKKLGDSTLAVAAAAKSVRPGSQAGVLFFTPQVFGAPLTAFVNYPYPSWTFPQLDFFQLECYDDVIAGNIAAQHTQLTTVMPQLGYPQYQYFGGFNLNFADRFTVWPLINQGLADAYYLGIPRLAIWSYTQITRDNIVFIFLG